MVAVTVCQHTVACLAAAGARALCWVLLLSFLSASLQETCHSHSHGELDPTTTTTRTKCWDEEGFFLLLYEVPPLLATLGLFS